MMLKDAIFFSEKILNIYIIFGICFFLYNNFLFSFYSPEMNLAFRK